MRNLLGLLKTGLLALLRYPRLLIAIGIVFLIGLVWFGGPLVGLSSVQTRTTLIVGIVFSRLLAVLINHYLANRSATLLEQSLQNQAKDQLMSARPDRREEIAAVRAQFEKAVATLKQSKFGAKGGGAAALYALPWYMFIGPSASGKSTALCHSGLRFPSLGESGKGLQGIGGTRNCDWWFTNEAVLLDTAGRYVTDDEDRDEWLAFLDLLKKFRKGKPINGILAAISVADLFQASEEELEVHAKKIRSRIDELIHRLGIVFPVYLVFTKSDLIKGFVEFFEELSRAEREQIWGCTFRIEDATAEAPQVRFLSELDVLVASLAARRLARLESARGPQKLSIYGFPLQFASGRDKLGRFVELLFQQNPYQENPIFRGFYFTSGTQEGNPIDRILSAVSRASGLRELATTAWVPTETKSYFIKNLFTDVIFPDKWLVRPSSAVHRQRDYVRVGAFAAAAVIVLCAIIGLAVSFIGNKALLSGALSAASNASHIGSHQAGVSEMDIDLLDRLGGRLQQVVIYEADGVPWRLWGLYEGHKIFQPLRDLYLRYFDRVILLPVKTQVENKLTQFASISGRTAHEDGDYYYSLLKLYLMMAESSHLNSSFLDRWLGNLWRDHLETRFGENGVPGSVREASARQTFLYSRYLARDTGIHFAVDRGLVDDTQRRLRQIPALERLYAVLRREAVLHKVQPVKLQNILHGSQQGILLSDMVVPGLYTYEGFITAFQPDFFRVLDEYGQEGWVTASPEIPRPELEEGLKRLYFADYVHQWLGFLASIHVRPIATPAEADEVLATLTDADPPFAQLFRVVMRNAGLESGLPGKAEEAVTGIIQKVKKKFGIESSNKDLKELLPARNETFATGFARNVSQRFKSINGFVLSAKENTEPPLNQYVGELRKIHQTLRPLLKSEGPSPDTKAIARSIVGGETGDLIQAVKITEGLVQRVDPELREALQPLLVEPLLVAMQGVLGRAKGDLNRRWEVDVYQPCTRTIEGRYPFRLVGEDAALIDVTEFFNPQNGIMGKFYQAELKPFIEEGSDQWGPKTWRGVGIDFSKEFLEALFYSRFVSDSLFQKSSQDLGVSFDVYPYPPLYPYPPQGGTARTVGEIRLDIGGQPMRYQMGPQEWHEMKWPGPTGTLGAVLQVQKGNGWQTLEHKGWWGLFKLFDAGRVSKIGETQFRAQWDFKSLETNDLQVQYDIRARSYKNPFQIGFFSHFKCVSQL